MNSFFTGLFPLRETDAETERESEAESAQHSHTDQNKPGFSPNRSAPLFARPGQPISASRSASSSPFFGPQAIPISNSARQYLDSQSAFSHSPPVYSKSFEERNVSSNPRLIPAYHHPSASLSAFSPSNSEGYLFSSFPSSLDSSSTFDLYSPKGPVGLSIPDDEELLGESAWQASEIAEQVLHDSDEDRFKEARIAHINQGQHSIEDDVFDIVGGMEGFEISSHAGDIGHEDGHAEHPSRTLRCVRIGYLSDMDIRQMFETYGVVRSITTNQRNLSEFFVSYFDIRHAKAAMRDLYRSGRKRNIEVHYFIQKDVIIDRDRNQGTLVVFNLDPSITNEELRHVFGQYGDVLEIRETPNKKHHKFIEFYDIRDAERAMNLLNKTDLRGKKIKIEISRPGGIRGRSHSNEMDEDIAPAQFSPVHAPAHISPQEVYQFSSIIPPQDGFRLAPSILGSYEMDSRVLSSSAPSSILPRDRRAQKIRTDLSDEKVAFKLDVVRVEAGDDIRTTCMIRNIPNKYTQKMLLSKVDENYKGTYDFFYLPIDFKNKCNVGYAFINFINPHSIPEFYREFNNKRWEKFNSEKICEISYARIQGKISLVAHFQNSSLLSEEKKCRPILFQSDGPAAGEQFPTHKESFPTSPSMNPTRLRQDSLGRQASPWRIQLGTAGKISQQTSLMKAM